MSTTTRSLTEQSHCPPPHAPTPRSVCSPLPPTPWTTADRWPWFAFPRASQSWTCSARGLLTPASFRERDALPFSPRLLVARLALAPNRLLVPLSEKFCTAALSRRGFLSCSVASTELTGTLPLKTPTPPPGFRQGREAVPVTGTGVQTLRPLSEPCVRCPPGADPACHI